MARGAVMALEVVSEQEDHPSARCVSPVLHIVGIVGLERLEG